MLRIAFVLTGCLGAVLLLATTTPLAAPSAGEKITPVSAPFQASLTFVFQDDMWVIGAEAWHTVWRSSDGENWTKVTEDSGYPLHSGSAGAHFDGKLWAIAGGPTSEIWHSADGANWNQATEDASFPARRHHAVVVFDEKLWVIGGQSPTARLNDVWYSEDGINWTQATPNAPFSKRQDHAATVFNGRIYLIGGQDGNPLNDIWYTEDGVQWTEVTSSSEFSPRYGTTVLAFDGRLWLIGGITAGAGGVFYLNDIWSSEDANSWTLEAPTAPFPPGYRKSSLVFDEQIWLFGGVRIGGQRSGIWTSPDAHAWRRAAAPAHFEPRMNSLVYSLHDNLWLLGGRTRHGDTYLDSWMLRPDGRWENKSLGLFGGRRPLGTGTVWNDKAWTLNIYGQFWGLQVWSSEDGILWSREVENAGMSYRSGMTTPVHDGKLWLIGGGTDGTGDLKNDVWKTADGRNWTRVTDRADFPGRIDHTSVVHEEKMWVIGGRALDGSSFLGGPVNDVWYSEDGAQWTLATGTAAFPPRQGHASVIYDNKMWVIGGFGADVRTNDVWSSGDGVQWSLVTDDAAFAPRNRLSSSVHDGRMWVAAGETDEGVVDDVWWSTNGRDWYQHVYTEGPSAWIFR